MKLGRVIESAVNTGTTERGSAANEDKRRCRHCCGYTQAACWWVGRPASRSPAKGFTNIITTHFVIIFIADAEASNVHLVAVGDAVCASVTSLRLCTAANR